MNHKAMVIVGLAGVIAMSTGVITFVSTRDSRGSDAALASENATEAAYVAYNDTQTVDDFQPTESEMTEDESQQPTEQTQGDADINGYTAALTSSDIYRVRLVYDHTTGGEVTAREVFGKLYSYCSLQFYSGGNFEMCINPTSGEIRRGAFKVYDDVISVIYDDGKGAEFSIIADSPGDIDYILVNYGDYDVYFGLH